MLVVNLITKPVQESAKCSSEEILRHAEDAAKHRAAEGTQDGKKAESTTPPSSIGIRRRACRKKSYCQSFRGRKQATWNKATGMWLGGGPTRNRNQSDCHASKTRRWQLHRIGNPTKSNLSFCRCLPRSMARPLPLTQSMAARI